MKTVLIADDEPAIRSLLSVILSEHYRVVEASNGEEALAVAQQERPDLALVDVIMPRLGGIAVARRLGNDLATASLPVVLLSGLYDPPAEVAVAGYLGKPFSPSVLLAKVEELIGR